MKTVNLLELNGGSQLLLSAQAESANNFNIIMYEKFNLTFLLTFVKK